MYLIAIIVVILDQFTKWLVVAHLAYDQAVVIIPGVLDLLYIQNRGAAFSMLINQRLLLIVVSLAVMVAVVYVERRYGKGRTDVRVALGLLLGGAAGNLIDRVRLGSVIDFVYLSFIHFPVFNLADSMIVLSILYLVVRFFFFGDRKVARRNGGEGADERLDG